MSDYQGTLTRLREYLLLPGEPDARLNPRWLARRLGVPERELLGALAYAVRDGLVELRWEVYYPVCGRSPGEFGSLKEAHSQIEGAACESCFDLHLDRDVRVTFSATETLGTRKHSLIRWKMWRRSPAQVYDDRLDVDFRS